jgi:hypothetical protein
MHSLRRLRRQLVLGWNQEADLHDPGCPVQSQSAARDRRLDHKAIPYDNFWRVARETGMHILKFAHASFIEEGLEPSFSEGTIRSTTGGAIADRLSSAGIPNGNGQPIVPALLRRRHAWHSGTDIEFVNRIQNTDGGDDSRVELQPSWLTVEFMSQALASWWF